MSVSLNGAIWKIGKDSQLHHIFSCLVVFRFHGMTIQDLNHHSKVATIFLNTFVQEDEFFTLKCYVKWEWPLKFLVEIQTGSEAHSFFPH